MFLVLTAAVVAVFAFCNIVVWVSTPARERLARDRLAVMEAVAESPGENARLVLEALRVEDERCAEKKAREEQRGTIKGGLIPMALGVGLGVLLAMLDKRDGIWAVGLMLFLIGCALLGVGVFGFRRTGKVRKGDTPV